MYCELDLMTSLKGTKLLPRVAWLAGDCFVQLIVIATLTMEQELVSALCSEYTIIPSYTPATFITPVERREVSTISVQYTLQSCLVVETLSEVSQTLSLHQDV